MSPRSKSGYRPGIGLGLTRAPILAFLFFRASRPRRKSSRAKRSWRIGSVFSWSILHIPMEIITKPLWNLFVRQDLKPPARCIVESMLLTHLDSNSNGSRPDTKAEICETSFGDFSKYCPLRNSARSPQQHLSGGPSGSLL